MALSNFQHHILLVILCLALGCNQVATPIEASSNPPEQVAPQVEEIAVTPPDYDTTQWLEVTDLDPTIRLDLRYATDNNFVGEKMYDCGRCFYRPKVARALVRVHQALRQQNLGLKMYDCYRPGPYQQRLWDKVPDPRYVARPEKGSVHSRGAAADLTVVHFETGEELDMGTNFDFFGKEAYTTTTDLPEEVLSNRKLFQQAMIAEGFLTIRTEWWHFNFAGPRFELSDWVWNCQ
ncbi:MAG: M15 family metallopeptidase [Bacteroidota bacterium]